ncbi:MAG: glycosyl hydrolase [Candidatus Woesebacteria bacterium]
MKKKLNVTLQKRKMFEKFILILIAVIGISSFVYLRYKERPLMSLQPASSPQAARPTPTKPLEPFRFGAYVGANVSDMTAFEKTIGKPLQILAVFVHWGNEKDFPLQYAASVRDRKKTLLIYWEAKDYTIDSVTQPTFNFDSVIRGDWDSYFKKFAEDAKSYNGPVILVPFDEMNGDWSPWSGTVNGNSPAKYVKAYQHLHAFFKTAPNVKFGWAVNNDSVPDTADNQFEKYYPGDAYVDYIGVDGFNFDDEFWETWDDVFADSLKRLEAYQKPTFIFSSASAPGRLKAQWILDFGTHRTAYPYLVGWIWFNENKEKNWTVNSDEGSLNAYKQVISALK